MTLFYINTVFIEGELSSDFSNNLGRCLDLHLLDGLAAILWMGKLRAGRLGNQVELPVLIGVEN
jgi:hypothetical protein